MGLLKTLVAGIGGPTNTRQRYDMIGGCRIKQKNSCLYIVPYRECKGNCRNCRQYQPQKRRRNHGYGAKRKTQRNRRRYPRANG